MASNYSGGASGGGAGGGRRGGGQVNFASFIQDLNEIPPADLSPRSDDWEKDLSMFTNTFMDWEKGQGAGAGPGAPDFVVPTEKLEKKPSPTTSEEPPAPASAVGDFDFPIADDFNNFDFGTFATNGVPGFADNLGNLQPLQPNQPVAYPSAHQGPYAIPSQAGTKRPSDAGHSRQLNFEEQSRVAAEEDKRRRNTAASARFRVKKKAREQALEKREKELSDEVAQLKNRITHLETENKWLRGLVMEKTGSKESKFDPKLAAALKVLGKDSDSEDDEKSKVKETRAGGK